MDFKALAKIKNLQAFLDTISFSEGTDRQGKDKSYGIRFGGFQFEPGDDHPRIVYNPKSFPQGSDAAGRYQIMSYTWDGLKKQAPGLLEKFTATYQDIAAMLLLSNRNALNDVCAGRFDVAVQKCSLEWASFPDENKGGASHYGGQPSRTLLELRNFYINHGGQISMIE